MRNGMPMPAALCWPPCPLIEADSLWFDDEVDGLFAQIDIARARQADERAQHMEILVVITPFAIVKLPAISVKSVEALDDTA